MDFLDEIVWSNPLRAWALALGVALAVAVGLRLILKLTLSRATRLSGRTANRVDDVIIEALGRTAWPTYLAVGVVATSGLLTLDDGVDTVLQTLLVLVLLTQGGLWLGHAVRAWLTYYRERQLEQDRGAATAAGAVVFILQVLIWTMVLLVGLSNLGVDITALITGLGVGGIAVALALQNVFSDLFASLSIVFDKPFVIGDFVIVGDHLGVVENVGLKTTRIRSLSGEQLVFSNSDLLGSRIRNFGRMYERRVVFNIGVTYQTPQDKLEAIPGMIRELVEALDKTRFDRSHFARFGDSALEFESVYYVLAPDYTLYMDIQQAINLGLRERFIAEGIEFAYPTRTVFLEGDAD